MGVLGCGTWLGGITTAQTRSQPWVRRGVGKGPSNGCPGVPYGCMGAGEERRVDTLGVELRKMDTPDTVARSTDRWHAGGEEEISPDCLDAAMVTDPGIFCAFDVLLKGAARKRKNWSNAALQPPLRSAITAQGGGIVKEISILFYSCTELAKPAPCFSFSALCGSSVWP